MEESETGSKVGFGAKTAIPFKNDKLSEVMVAAAAAK